ncbi:tetratricopeptide repeat protein [Oenococcus oeni]|uniref:TPR repeat protein n=1 Tax=Oenococcus oeni (strain ATCC BAA-331 / PSU-1) TaxID=203123 RepID=Q04GJ0_OENOB|nr:tetratricopeptide repeat protein [Oenococcus oeni]ABJ56432.1 TPR repeat protein [Oenococcus oeni PSU-1]OIK68583.1 hypothetical protein ATW66_02205 [Oenococcus oeni]OIL15577.1 hypothetical protein ATW95_02495 [Oenococcus oeni]OIL30165.1 hypothetical protein ATX04_01790 [Oenococcus oeni]OIL82028.1 hypothetical protein ATX37_02340 [Oenococcus oeni]
MKKHNFLFVFTCLLVLATGLSFGMFGNNSITHQVFAKTANKEKAKKLYDTAVKEFSSGSETKAVAYWKKSAKLGSALAESQVASQYLNGMGVKKDYQKALYWAKRAYKHGENSGMTANTLGTVYLNGSKNVKKNYKKALTYFKKGISEDYMKSYGQLAYMYLHGYGVKANTVTAVKWYTKAANKGDITSKYYWGQIYEKGKGTNQNYSEAMIWYKKCAANDDDVSAPGVIESMSAIANLYANGLGVTKDYQQAEQWYQKAFNASQKEVALLKQNS